VVELLRGVAGESDQTQMRVIAAQTSHGGHSVQQRHVEVDHDGVRIECLRELDRDEAVLGRADDGQLRLLLDQRLQRLDERRVVVGEQNTNSAAATPIRVHLFWNASLAAVAVQQAERTVAVIGAPLDLGSGRRGVDMGPSAIRYAGLDSRIRELGLRCVDWGNVEAAVAESTSAGDEQARFLPQILQACDRVARLVERAVENRCVPLVLGGDHSIGLGTLVGLARASGPGGVLWIDAHGDLNTPRSSPSGNVHGMVLAAALGLGGETFAFDEWRLPAIAEGRLALVGLRSLDSAERELVQHLDAKVFTMSDIDRIGVERAIRESLAHIAGPGFVHVSLDMDVVDPAFAPGVGTPVRGGLSYREAHLALELVAEAGLAESLEVVEVNPILDRENETGKLAVELVASALGARIL
jgi:arginase